MVALVRFKDGSYDVFGSMNVAGLCYCVHIVQEEHINELIRSS